MSDFIDSVELGEEFLEHFGVKGMKWGRKSAKKSSPSGPDKYGFATKARGTNSSGNGSSRPINANAPKSNKSRGKKVAFGVMAIAGAAAAAYVISQGGKVPTRAIGPVVSSPQTVSAVRGVTSSPAFRSTLNDLDAATASLIGGTDRMLGR